MKYALKILICAITLVTIIAEFSLQAASSCAPVKKTRQSRSTKTCISPGTYKQPEAVSRGMKLKKKHSREIRLLNDIHKLQIDFLKQYKAKIAQASDQDRNQLQALINELPYSVKNSDFPYLDRMLFMEQTIYSILAGKEKYESKKKITDPEKLLKDIQKKQRLYLLKLQKQEMKRVKS